MTVKNNHPVHDITALYEMHASCHLVVAKEPFKDDTRQCKSIAIYCPAHDVDIIEVED